MALRKTFVFLICIFLLSCVLSVSCQKNSDEPGQGTDIDFSKIKRTILVYAVNHSSLSYDFNDDLKEMLKAYATLDERNYQVLLYKTDSKESCGLYRIIKNKENICELQQVKSYVRDKTSTSPIRIGEVIDTALGMFPNAEYDLIFWGHATSWMPDYSDHQVKNYGIQKSYGGEYNGSESPSGYKYTDWVNIDDLADAVPDHRFQTIWFDCCYMAGIEVVYEFRDKCDLFVGYPTEVWSEGMPYDVVLPRLLKANPDVTGAARCFFEWYDDNGAQASVAVVDMESIHKLADISSEIIQSAEQIPAEADLLNYSRIANKPLYDFRQYIHLVAMQNGNEQIVDNFDKIFYNTVLYSACSARDFNNRPWPVGNPSCISTHCFRDDNTSDSNFYKNLDWYKRLYKR